MASIIEDAMQSAKALFAEAIKKRRKQEGLAAKEHDEVSRPDGRSASGVQPPDVST